MEKFQKKNYLMVSGEITLEEVKNKFSLNDILEILKLLIDIF